MSRRLVRGSVRSRSLVRAGSLLTLGAVGLLAVACDDSPTGGDRPFPDLTCSIDESQLLSGGVPVDGIPSLQNPVMVAAASPAASYLNSGDRVMGMVLDGRPVAIPHNVLWWHEIVNLETASGQALAITYCPLTGTSMVFDRAAAGGAELGVSGLLFRSNLVMFDRSTGSSLWPQMSRGARCGPADGTPLSMVAVWEMSWEGWRSLHPETEVLGEEQGFDRDYTLYPYGDYERLTNSRTLVPMGGLDGRRPPKERVLGIPTLGADGIAFPFQAMNLEGPRLAFHPELAPQEAVIFWDRQLEGAMAYRPRMDGEPLTFVLTEEDRIVDEETGSEWRMDGLAVAGPLAGRSLEPIDEAYVAFWFAWADFHPGTELWLP